MRRGMGVEVKRERVWLTEVQGRTNRTQQMERSAHEGRETLRTFKDGATHTQRACALSRSVCVCMFLCVCHLSCSSWPIQASHLWHGSRAPSDAVEDREMRSVSTDQLNAVTRCSTTAGGGEEGGGGWWERRVNQSAAAGKADLLVGSVMFHLSPGRRRGSGGLTDWRPMKAFNLSLAAVLSALRSHVSADLHVCRVTRRVERVSGCERPPGPETLTYWVWLWSARVINIIFSLNYLPKVSEAVF